jgi:hypothetical protein
MSRPWRTLVLVYPVVDARLGSGLTRRRAQAVMARDERAAVDGVVGSLPSTIATWSDGLAVIDPLDVVVVRRPIGSLSASGKGRWWVGPREVRQELAEVAATGTRYDSVVVLWPRPAGLELCGWGCTVGPSDRTFDAGFSSISTDHWPSLATDPDPAQGYVHEWLHQVEAVYRGLGLDPTVLPNLHDAGDFTSTRSTSEPPYGYSYAGYHDGGQGRPGARTWRPWYADWMTGRLRRTEDAGRPAALVDDGPVGLTPERWAIREAVDAAPDVGVPDGGRMGR